MHVFLNNFHLFTRFKLVLFYNRSHESEYVYIIIEI